MEAMVFGIFGVCWVMPKSAVELLACWQGQFGHHHNGYIYGSLMWCIGKQRNSRCFEDSECFMFDLKLFDF